jgi:hypothetical protein
MAAASLSKSTGEMRVAAAYGIAQPIIAGRKARFVKLRSGGKTAAQVKAERLAKKNAAAKNLDPTEAEYVRSVEVFER